MTSPVLGAAILGCAALAAGCATAMTATQFNEKLPSATRAKYYDKTGATSAVAAGQCKVLVDGRKYTAPIGMTVSEDLNNGARGIDEWVAADKGNAYSVANFEWLTVGDSGATQLIIYCDTLLCQ